MMAVGMPITQLSKHTEKILSLRLMAMPTRRRKTRPRQR
jgi:hypothetical protein